MHWFTNGIKNLLAYECPKGFWKGKTCSEEFRQKCRDRELKKKVKEAEANKQAAELDAQAEIAKANGAAEAQKIRAEAQAFENQKIAQNLATMQAQWRHEETMERLQHWNGKEVSDQSVYVPNTYDLKTGK